LPGCLFTPPVRKQVALRGRDPADPEIAAEIDRVGEVFRESLRRSFRAPPAEQSAWVHALPKQDQSVAWEATAMAVGWLERNTGSEQTWQGLSASQGPEHQVGLALGLGWALSWLKLSPEGQIEQLSPLLRWRVLDGYGFRDGLVFTRRYALARDLPPHVGGFGTSIWRQGLGRSLWYTTHADVGEISQVVAGFSASDQVELWRGLGVAATFIGSLAEAPIAELKAAAGDQARWLALGCAMAARTVRDAGGPMDRQTAPCSVLAGSTPGALAELTDAAEAALPEAETEEPHFQAWMNGIASRLA